MTAHTHHPPSLEVGLVDGCPRCEQHADDPLAALDVPHLNDLWARMIRVEFDDDLGVFYRSHAEARACLALYQHAKFLGRIGEDPREVTFR